MARRKHTDPKQLLSVTTSAELAELVPPTCAASCSG
jgi:hypothetical protein